MNKFARLKRQKIIFEKLLNKYSDRKQFNKKINFNQVTKTVKLTFQSYPIKITILLSVMLLGFAIGTTTHIFDLMNHGWILNPEVPKWKNIFWVSLTFFDFLIVVLLLTKLKLGLLFANIIIIADVLVNTNFFKFDRLGYDDDYKIYLQVIFLIYVLISSLIVLKLKPWNTV